ncbi:hypothetical protein [Planktotalea arctica]|uniref:hypothetical protein n=1 Tax=Planktotalea arctica TaxID=1481893 RepID=UPI003219CFF8
MSRSVDRFLDEQELFPSGHSASREADRPNAHNVNAMQCAACNQSEYLSRDYCRCGHYLRGQLEDEYLTWEKGLQANHKSMLEVIERKMKPMRYLIATTIPFMLVPLAQLTFWPDNFSIGSFLYWAPAMMVAGASAVIERFLKRPLVLSTFRLENYTFQSFLEERRYSLNEV